MALGSIIMPPLFGKSARTRPDQGVAAEVDANMEVSFTLKFSRLISLLFFQTFEGITYFLVSPR